MIGNMQTPDDRNRKQEDPKIGNQVRNVGKVAKSNQIEAFAGYSRIPEFSDGPAFKSQNNGDGQNP